MTLQLPASVFAPVGTIDGARVESGLSSVLDQVATVAPASHRFLRYGWFAAALQAYGGGARTCLVGESGQPVLALPLVTVGPAAFGIAQVPGCYWPFRGFPAAEGAGSTVYDSAVGALARTVRALRLGPIYDGDPTATRLIEAARARGWAIRARTIADSFELDIASAEWPRNSTLRKNRFHEKHLAAHGTLDWSFHRGGAWTPALFDALAAVEQASWIADRTDGSDAKFASARHGAFWRAATTDPVLAEMMHAALLTVNGKPTAFAFDLDAGALRYAIANSYDPAVAKHSPGRLLAYRSLALAKDAGIARVDWGAGDSGYKRTMGAVQGSAIRDWLLIRPGASGLIARLIRGWSAA
jgi:CelD/BcsL family acetyltransferase involved in cellulose biosynthesis